LRVESRVFDGAFGGYSAGNWRLGKKIEVYQIFDFHKNLRNSPTSYLFTKSSNPHPITSKLIIKHFNFNPQRKISPKNPSALVLIKNFIKLGKNESKIVLLFSRKKKKTSIQSI
jgi:hypothetical protein